MSCQCEEEGRDAIYKDEKYYCLECGEELTIQESTH